ncbi:hypothetical protein [Microbispora sp. NBC_01389]|uniref:hypothetical protein n=1 Tax=Microbispora sp. NBC_01389 TaxID=2903584 RepID=UPI00325029E0
MTDGIGVLVADDEDLIRTGLRIIIESEPGLSVVGEVGHIACGASSSPVWPASSGGQLPGVLATLVRPR